jgi:putative two-component system response regulator
LELFRLKRHAVVITDIDMPVMNGVEMIQEIRKLNPRQSIVVISGQQEANYLIDLINQNVHHFIPKPFEREVFFSVLEVVLRYMRMQELERNYQRQLEHAVALKTRELQDSLQVIKELSDEVVFRLSTAVEYRDNFTGTHINRMSRYAGVIASALSLDGETTEALRFSAPLHDIGKIGIPDQILLKRGALNSEEFSVMRTHTTIGASILENSRYGRIKTACTVARCHHEHYDGTGYPLGLKGEDIPLEGRIIAVCDVYDALRSSRPYKEEICHEEACLRILEGDERTLPSHFDPGVLGAFRETGGEFERIYNGQALASA